MVELTVSQLSTLPREKAEQVVRFLREWEPRFILTNADGTEAGYVSEGDAYKITEASTKDRTPCLVKMVWIRKSDGLRVDAPRVT